MLNGFQYGTKFITYYLKVSSSRSTINLTVLEGQLHVTIPIGTEKSVYEEVIRKKAPWIIKQLIDYEEMSSYTPTLQFRSGEKLPYLGRYYRLQVIPMDVSKSMFNFKNGLFECVVPQQYPVTQYRTQLLPLYIKWITEKGTQFANKRIKRFTQRLGQAPTGISIRNMEKRWGSCTPEQKILLNWRIFLAPVSMVDYVLAHEIAHLKEMNHTPVYWETLRMLIPDYEERKEWLRVNGNQLYI